MRNKFIDKVAVWPIVALFGLLIALAVSLSLAKAYASQPPESSGAVNIDVAEAERRIATQQGVDEIPRKIWKRLLSKAQYKILWEKGTERAFTGELLKNKREGVYVSAGCKLPVFVSSHKFKSGSGWPSFWEVFDKKNIKLKDDSSWGMKRTEVLSSCGEHLGHVFNDGPDPTGLRYCINSLALEFIPMAEYKASLEINSQ